LNKNGIVLSQRIDALSASRAAVCDKVSGNHNVTIILNCVIIRSYLLLYTLFNTSGSGYFSFYFCLRRSQ